MPSINPGFPNRPRLPQPPPQPPLAQGRPPAPGTVFENHTPDSFQPGGFVNTTPSHTGPQPGRLPVNPDFINLTARDFQAPALPPPNLPARPELRIDTGMANHSPAGSRHSGASPMSESSYRSEGSRGYRADDEASVNGSPFSRESSVSRSEASERSHDAPSPESGSDANSQRTVTDYNYPRGSASPQEYTDRRTPASATPSLRSDASGITSDSSGIPSPYPYEDQGVRIRTGDTPPPMFSRSPSFEPDPFDLPTPFVDPFARPPYGHDIHMASNPSSPSSASSPSSPSSASQSAAFQSESGSGASTPRPFHTAPTPEYHAPTPGGSNPPTPGWYNAPTPGGYSEHSPLSRAPTPEFAPTPGGPYQSDLSRAPTPGYAPTPGGPNWSDLSRASTPGFSPPTPRAHTPDSEEAAHLLMSLNPSPQPFMGEAPTPARYPSSSPGPASNLSHPTSDVRSTGHSPERSPSPDPDPDPDRMVE
jgi:hypothetical protein